uniref:dITP/XTP pyrophosphatase n=1 Tax=uncultured prokaryote TaxID=198431 RepID=H5SEL6_9ZZZZ|nr:nucleoside-triphosphatase [uncultured prokaryote]
MEIVISTRNMGKAREILEILGDLKDVTFLTLDSLPEVGEIEEDGKSYLENALKKALYVAHITKRIAIADDSGLEVDALGGKPGIHSARYAGKDSSDYENNIKLLDELKDVPFSERRARYVCIAALATPSGEVFWEEGICDGFIGFELRGDKGFGYDPVFVLPSGRTMAELEPWEKHAISHRGKAFRKLRNIIEGLMKR